MNSSELYAFYSSKGVNVAYVRGMAPDLKAHVSGLDSAQP